MWRVGDPAAVDTITFHGIPERDTRHGWAVVAASLPALAHVRAAPTSGSGALPVAVLPSLGYTLPARAAFVAAGNSVGAWRSLVARIVRDDEVGGSNPLAPTNRFTCGPTSEPSVVCAGVSGPT